MLPLTIASRIIWATLLPGALGLQHSLGAGVLFGSSALRGRGPSAFHAGTSAPAWLLPICQGLSEVTDSRSAVFSVFEMDEGMQESHRDIPSRASTSLFPTRGATESPDLELETSVDLGCPQITAGVTVTAGAHGHHSQKGLSNPEVNPSDDA